MLAPTRAPSTPKWLERHRLPDAASIHAATHWRRDYAVNQPRRSGARNANRIRRTKGLVVLGPESRRAPVPGVGTAAADGRFGPSGAGRSAGGGLPVGFDRVLAVLKARSLRRSGFLEAPEQLADRPPHARNLITVVGEVGVLGRVGLEGVQVDPKASA